MASHQTKKFVAITSILTLLGSVALAGCSASEKSGDATPPSGGQPTPPLKKVEISSSLYDRGSVPPAEGTIEDNKWTKWINQNAPVNVKFTPVSRWESQAKFNTLFASGSAPDLIFEYDSNIRNQLYGQKQLMPIDDLVSKSVEYKKFLEQNPGVKKLATLPDGKMYYFGRILGASLNVGLAIRQDWLDKLNLKVPTTTDELLQVAKAFAEQDPDGNGKKDTFGYQLSFIGGTAIDVMFENVAGGYVLKDGQLVHDYDRAKGALDLKKKLFDAGVVDKDFLTDKGEKALQDFVNGKLGIIGMNNIAAPGVGLKNFETLRANNPNAKMTFIPFPTSPYGSFSWGWSPIQLTAAVNANAKDPQAVMNYVDFLEKESTQLTLAFGEKDKDYTLDADGCPKLIDPKKSFLLNDLTMLNNQGLGLLGKCSTPEKAFDSSIPLQKEYLGLLQDAKKAYLNPQRPFAGVWGWEYQPTLPQDLAALNTQLGKTITDIASKAIVSGASYTVDQAMADSKAAWVKGGGDKIDVWFKDWYEKNKNSYFSKKEMYDQYVK